MPKNGKPTYPPIRPVPPITPRPPKGGDEGFDGGSWTDSISVEPLRLHLTHLDPLVIATLHAGDPVILQIDSLPIVVTTLLGLPIGQVGIDDVATVRSRRARRGVVVAAQTNPLGCVVEVR